MDSCPIGLDDSPAFCSAGICEVCRRYRMRQHQAISKASNVQTEDEVMALAKRVSEKSSKPENVEEWATQLVNDVI